MRLSLPSRPSMKTREAGRSRQVPRLLVTRQLSLISKQPTWRQQMAVVEPGPARTAAAMAVAVTPVPPPSAEAKAEIEAEAAATRPLAPTVAMPMTAATEEAVHRSIGHQSERGTHQLCFPSPPRAARPRSGLMRRTRRRRRCMQRVHTTRRTEENTRLRMRTRTLSSSTASCTGSALMAKCSTCLPASWWALGTRHCSAWSWPRTSCWWSTRASATLSPPTVRSWTPARTSS
mmetsp:Transcript_4679/g.11645  ORF Transcript_4679/g.11645 Transcript_4679/m.11645 type:complete len:233 (+) Transcript_4679:762-1460(+)